jgi:hypothetical protein
MNRDALQRTLLMWLVPSAASDPIKLGTPVLSAGVSGFEGLVIELILTFFPVWVIFATAADPRGAFRSIARGTGVEEPAPGRAATE